MGETHKPSRLQSCIEGFKSKWHDKTGSYSKMVESTKAQLAPDPHGISDYVSDLHQMLGRPLAQENIVAESPSMRALLQQATKFAQSPATVLLTGESGTGKEVIAKWIHQQSPRKCRPYVRINCAALPESLMESELFGHERGAFTGADCARAGHFSTAADGSILLDEISEISLPMQAKLLRVLEEGEYQPLGCNRVEVVQARVIATSNQCLMTAVGRGVFREDLYYRLNVLRLSVPPLRERPEDIAALARFFVDKFGKEDGSTVKRISEEAVEELCRFDWPGNVRELRNIIQRACVVTEGNQLLAGSIDWASSPVSEQIETDFEALSLKDAERTLILRSLQRNNGNKTAAARELGVTSRTLLNKIKHYRDLGISDAALDAA